MPDGALWSPEDAAWASRLADETAGAAATAPAWLRERARHARERLLPRRASLRRADARRVWNWRWVATALLVGAALGIAMDLVGPQQRIDLLALPLWGIVAWNLIVYLGLAATALAAVVASTTHRGTKKARTGLLRRAVQRWLGGAAREVAASASASPVRRFSALWAQVSAPLAASRAALWLHLAAAALALGLMAGLYARALVLDYRVSWQSTLLEPAQVHTLLATAFAPASAVTGIAVPGVDAVAALRSDATGAPRGGATGALPGGVSGTSPAGAPVVPGTAMALPGAVAAMPRAAAALPSAAAPWLHLLAATLALAVLVPRTLLALFAAGQSAWRARRIVLPLDGPYLQAVLRTRRSGAAARPVRVVVLPHGFVPSPAATLALRAALAAQFESGLDLQVAASTPYGDEDAPAPSPASSPAATPAPATTWCIAWCELAATPEPQAQGRFLERLVGASPPPVLLLVDETSYRQRLGADSPRIGERRRLWQQLADTQGVPLACIDLGAGNAADAAEASAAASALRAALQGLPEPAAVR